MLTENDWINVNDRLPEWDEEVLVLGEQKGSSPQMGGAYVSIAKRQDLSKLSKGAVPHRVIQMQDENQFSHMNYVTHWMPLPPKPKK